MRLWIRWLPALALLATALPAQAESPLAEKIAESGKVVIGIANEAPYGFAAVGAPRIWDIATRSTLPESVLGSSFSTSIATGIS